MRAFIVIGDKTDHGGQVIEAAGATDTYGKRIARVGDKVSCPKKGHHGTTVIVTGDPTMIIDGKAVARHGDKTACGAILIASQSVGTVGPGAGSGASAGDTARKGASAGTGAANGAAEQAPPPPYDFDEQVELLTNTAFAEGLPYHIRAGGQIYSGRVGADGRLPRVDTAGSRDCDVTVGDGALALMKGVMP